MAPKTKTKNGKDDEAKLPPHLRSAKGIENQIERLASTAERFRKYAETDKETDELAQVHGALVDSIESAKDAIKILQQLPDDWAPPKKSGVRKVVEAGETVVIRDGNLENYEGLIEADDRLEVTAIRGKLAECKLEDERIFVPVSHLKTASVEEAEA